MLRLEVASTHLMSAGSGEAVVLLHCLGSDLHFWDEPARMLADRHAVIRYDFPGHGRTPVPSGEYTIHDLGDHCAALLQSLGISRAHLIGTSLGGLVAMDVAARWPSRVTGLVLADTTAKYTPQMAAGLTQRANLAIAGDMAAVIDETLKVWFTPQAIESQAAVVSYARGVLARTAVAGYSLAVKALCGADLVASLAQIGCPTLVMCGRDDAAFVQPSQELASRIANAQLRWLAPARHAGALEFGSVFAVALQAFIDK